MLVDIAYMKTNDYGSRLANFVISRRMFIGSTKFEHKDIHKITWKERDGNARNQIDHILIDSRHISDLLDVRSCRGANIESDHFLVGAKIRAGISTAKRQQAIRIKRYNIERLKAEDVRKMYVANLEASLHVPTQQNEVVGIDKRWTRCKQAILQTDACLGFDNRKRRGGWFDLECAVITNKKNAAYRIALQKHKTRNAVEAHKKLKKEEKQTHWRKKREWETNNLEEIERLQRMKEVRKYYRKTNKKGLQT